MAALMRWNELALLGALGASAVAGCEGYDGPAEVARARAEGMMARATIVSVRDTGSRRDALHYVAFTLQVDPRQGRPFTREMQTLLDPIEAARRTPGQSVQIRFLPDDPLYFAFAP
jgi:hypothetical protein